MTAIVPPSHLDLASTASTAILSTLGTDGLLQSTLVWFEYEQPSFRVSLTTDRQKYQNIREVPVATLVVVDWSDQSRYLEVRAQAFLERDADNAFVNRTYRRYTNDTSCYPWDAAETERVVLTLSPIRIVATSGSPT